MSLWNLYVGTFTAEFVRQFKQAMQPSEGIERFVFDDADGSLEHVETISGLSSPQYLEVHPRLPILYATEFAQPGTLVAFAINGDGTLTCRSKTGSLGELAVAVSVHPSLRFAYVANWGDGTLSTFALDEAGSVQAP